MMVCIPDGTDGLEVSLKYLETFKVLQVLTGRPTFQGEIIFDLLFMIQDVDEEVHTTIRKLTVLGLKDFLTFPFSFDLYSILI